MLRELVSKLNRSLAEHLVPPRKKYSVPIKVWFEPDKNLRGRSAEADAVAILGETYDVSKTGIAFIVSFIRIKEKYLVGQDRTLNVELELPNRRVFMKVIGRRYERVGVHLSAEKFLVGAEIRSIGEDDRRSYEYFLKYGNKLKKTATANLELGID